MLFRSIAGNILDVVITNDEEHTYDTPVVVRAPTMADHFVTVVDYLIEGPTRTPPKRARWELNTNKRNWEVWNAMMEQLNISESMDNAASLNEATELLNNAILQADEAACPLRLVRGHQYDKQTPEYRRLLRKQRRRVNALREHYSEQNLRAVHEADEEVKNYRFEREMQKIGRAHV